MTFTTLRVVVSFDVNAIPTLEVRALATVGGALLSIILLICFKTLMCCIFSAYPILIASFVCITNSSAANTLESSSKIAVTLQCAGSIFCGLVNLDG